ncbi:50S ribosomal protein L10 [Candidatus Legionella polyplacis]|uniref:50S ribosomal protein L10 n=1 Tax=Candidatus Legionella polyplacis TaxID=2005262 RepID=UPI000C1E0B62|nr:50S ribosomal protein L10 [Candidatus Legionella polyplacis]ATW01772.1 50S ribosomal protein L10 [Candidatus Legionella polyplacis]
MLLTLDKKKDIVKEIVKVFSEVFSIALIDFYSLNSNQMNELRYKARNTKVYVRVVRNTLLYRSFQEMNLSNLNFSLVNSTCFIYSKTSYKDVAALLTELIKKFGKIKIKLFMVNGLVYGCEKLDFFANLPSYKEAIISFLHLIKAPINRILKVFYLILLRLFKILYLVKDVKKRSIITK